MDPTVIAELQNSLDLLSQYFVSMSHDHKDKSDVDSKSKAIAMALYGDLLPSYAPVKLVRETVLGSGQSDLGTLFPSNIPHGLYHSFVEPLHSPPMESIFDWSNSICFTASPDDDTPWHEYVVYLSLHIFCVVTAREPEFYTMKPLYDFTSFIQTLKVRLIHAAPMIARFVAFRSSSMKDEFCIAATALSLLLHSSRQLSHQSFVRTLCGSSVTGPEYLTRVFVTSLSWEHQNGDVNKLCRLKLKLIDMLKSSLTADATSVEDSLSHTVMGLTGWSLSYQTVALNKPISKQRLKDFSPYPNVLDAILTLITVSLTSADRSFLVLAAASLEFLYRFLSTDISTTSQSWSQAKQCVISKLRLMGFWEKTLLTLTDTLKFTLSSQNDSIRLRREFSLLHGISWTLKCFCIEYMAAHDHDFFGSDSKLILHGQINSFLKVYYGLIDTVRHIPRVSPIQDLINAPHLLGHIPLERVEGPFDICSGFQVINMQKFSDILKASTNRDNIEEPYIRWAHDWNMNVEFACAHAHLSKSSTLFLRVIILLGCYHEVVDVHAILSLISILLSRAMIEPCHELNSQSIEFESRALAQALLPISHAVLWLIEVLGQVPSNRECDSHELLTVVYLFLHTIRILETPDGLLDECVGILSCALSSFLLLFWPTLSPLSLSDSVDLKPCLGYLEKISTSNHCNTITIRDCTKSALVCLEYLSEDTTIPKPNRSEVKHPPTMLMTPSVFK